MQIYHCHEEVAFEVFVILLPRARYFEIVHPHFVFVMVVLEFDGKPSEGQKSEEGGKNHSIQDQEGGPGWRDKSSPSRVFQS